MSSPEHRFLLALALTVALGAALPDMPPIDPLSLQGLMTALEQIAFGVLLGLTGLAFFHPAFFFFSNVLGGPVWSRILHPFLGIVMAISFVGLARRVWHENFIKPVDIEWLKRIKEVINNVNARAGT